MVNKWLVLFLLLAGQARAQIWNNTDTLYGNEWIDFSRTYYKIRVAEDGLYRVSFETLKSAGFPVATVPGAQFRLYRYGRQEPLFVTTDGLLSDQDYVEFFGQRNRDALDRPLFEQPEEENVNPDYSLFNDTTVYFLCWETGGQALWYSATPNDLSNPPAREPYCWTETGYYYSNYLFKRQISQDIAYSWFNGDGFGTFPEADFSVNISPRKWYAGGPDARLRVRYASGLGDHHKRLIWNDSLMAEDVFDDWKIVQHELAISSSSLKLNNALRLQSALGGADRHAVASVWLRYPRIPDFENAPAQGFWLEGSPANRYLEIQAFQLGGGSMPVLYDLTNRLRLETVVEGGLVKALLPASAQERRLWLANPVSGIKPVQVVEPVQFYDFLADDPEYIMLSNRALFSDPDANGANHVAAYADYRRSAAGGGFRVGVVDVNDLYDQFAYGVRFHPMAIRNYLQFILKHGAKPRFLLLIGKGLDYDRFRRPDVQAQLVDSLFFVPTFGSPGADQLLVMRDKKLSEVMVPVGRLAVSRASAIRVYLNKVIEHEQTFATAPQTLAGKSWMKRVVHNSGGLAGEAAVIRAYTENMANELSNNRVGADVHTFYKTSNDPIQLSSYEQMLDLINEGVSIWTIFGHSSPNAVDFDIGSPTVYDNKGKYPLMMIMGCFSGLCSAPQQGIGEQFLLAPDRGAIAYFASVNFSFVDALHDFGTTCYQRLGGTDYGLSIGQVLAGAVDDLRQTGYPALIALLHQNLLQGDPALKLHHYSGPDYVVDPSSVRFSPNPVGLEQPFVRMDVDLVNLGEHIDANLPFNVEQRRPDGVLISRLADSVLAPAYRKSLSLNLPTAGSQAGFNRFLLQLDPGNALAEQPSSAEMNNVLTDASGQPGVELFFFADDVAPVLPEPFAIVSTSPVTLRASTLNAGALAAPYRLELDTLESFDSPFKQSTMLFKAGGLLEWTPSVTLQDSAVYYWRIARDSLVNGQLPWRTRSFVYLPGSAPGWNQSHYGQFASGAFINLEPQDSSRLLAFVNSAGFISINVAYRNRDRYPGLQNIYYEGFFGDAGFNGQGLQHGIAVMVQDPNTGHIVPNLPNSPYNSDPVKAKPLFSFNTRDSVQRIALMDFLENRVPQNAIVGLLALHAWNDTLGYAPRQWALDSVSYGKNLFQVLEAQGAQKVRSLVNYTQGPHPYGLIFQKDNPGFSAVDTVVYPIDSVLNIRRTFKAKWSVGQLETPPIGPVRAWKSLHWASGPTDDPSDGQRVSVLGVRDAQPDTLLLTLTQPGDSSLAWIPAATYPQLKLRYEVSDTVLRTATQPGYLRILYTPLPEGAISPGKGFEFYADTLEQGEKGHIKVAYTNISGYGQDSLLVRFRLEGEKNPTVDYSRRFRSLPPGDTLQAWLSFGTADRRGKQRLLVAVNPGDDQPEMASFNNTLVQEFYVNGDVRNPLLDVTFDGRHILDGDLVSPRPVIIISLADENKFLALTDTASFSLKIILPNGAVRSISLSDPEVLFLPADPADLAGKNRARLEWRPVFDLDGEYRLLVNGRDAAGNAAGTLDYGLRFRVVTRSSISHVLNHPNPFSTSTCFVYTLTGAETPAYFRIQIMTMSGKIVREITEAEFGPLQTGTHTGDYCWDGRDQYGDQLANGVYLYRVHARKADGASFDLFSNSAVDGFFTGGYGKMVLMR